MRPSAGSCISGTYSMLPAWERVAAKLPLGKGPGAIGEESAEYEPTACSCSEEG